jgi:hypothetical protein
MIDDDLPQEFNNSGLNQNAVSKLRLRQAIEE